MVILVVFKVFLLVKNLEILIQIVPDNPIYYYIYIYRNKNCQRTKEKSIKILSNCHIYN